MLKLTAQLTCAEIGRGRGWSVWERVGMGPYEPWNLRKTPRWSNASVQQCTYTMVNVHIVINNDNDDDDDDDDDDNNKIISFFFFGGGC